MAEIKMRVEVSPEAEVRLLFSQPTADFTVSMEMAQDIGLRVLRAAFIADDKKKNVKKSLRERFGLKGKKRG